jgi:molecular chaperone DnaK
VVSPKVMPAVGIDLGTTNSVVACTRGGRVHVLGDEQGRRLLPSVVSFPPNGEVLVGYPAKERRGTDARNTIASVKRMIGRAWDSQEIKRARSRFAFEMREGLGQGPLVVARAQAYTLPEISAFVLQRMKQIAETALGEAVVRAVITVPANFNELQRAATKVAGRIAGLDVIRIINEPTAAALAYGYGRATKERICIYDFGGGTFDCTLLELSGNVFEVLATAGDTFLGGDDLDLAIADRMADAFVHVHRSDPRANPQAFERLRAAAEAMKIELSTSDDAHVTLHEVSLGLTGTPLGLDFAMTSAELDVLAAPLVERTFTVCQEALAIARLPVTAFDKVILVGGSTRNRFVRRRVEQFFGSPPLDRVNPVEVVAIGAAIQAAALTEVARVRSIPAPPTPGTRQSLPDVEDEMEEVTRTTQVSSQLAALQRGRADVANVTASPDTPRFSRSSTPPAVPIDRVSSPVLVDVTPRALVVQTVGGWCDVIVQRNAKIPCERTRAFTTSSDMQTKVRVRVAQGEDPLFDNNTFLGEVDLMGLRAGPRGTVTVQVKFEVDESGTLEVFATDVATGRQAQALLQLVGIAGAQSVSAMQVRHAASQVR